MLIMNHLQLISTMQRFEFWSCAAGLCKELCIVGCSASVLLAIKRHPQILGTQVVQQM